MGREVKRVPVDFNWPLNKVWGGFLMPKNLLAIHCERCDGTGYNDAMRRLKDRYYGFDGLGIGWSHNLMQDEVDNLVNKGRLFDFTHFWTKEKGWQPRPGNPIPTAEQVNVWSCRSFGHDAINRMILCEFRGKKLGIYGLCEKCKGEGEYYRDVAHKAAYDAWKETPPPTGPAYQIWETVSEGSPVSPPFLNPMDLANWLVRNDSTVTNGTTYETWLKFIAGPGWAPSMVIENGKMMSGVGAMIK